jgi:hypothetical protein
MFANQSGTVALDLVEGAWCPLSQSASLNSNLNFNNSHQYHLFDPTSSPIQLPSPLHHFTRRLPCPQSPRLENLPFAGSHLARRPRPTVHPSTRFAPLLPLQSTRHPSQRSQTTQRVQPAVTSARTALLFVNTTTSATPRGRADHQARRE